MYLWTQITIVYGLLYRKSLWPLVILTLLSAYSRPYVGMHHVLDSVGGMVFGGIMGSIAVHAAYRWIGTGTPQENANASDSDAVADTSDDEHAT